MPAGVVSLVRPKLDDIDEIIGTTVPAMKAIA